MGIFMSVKIEKLWLLKEQFDRKYFEVCQTEGGNTSDRSAVR